MGLILALPAPVPADAFGGRRAVLYAEATVMLAENAPWVSGRSDCSCQMWRLLSKVFPELRTQKWFRRTTAAVMADWPWEPLMSLDEVYFGDLLFTGRPKLNHVMMTWTDPDQLIHASKRRGFTVDELHPYWAPRIEAAIRPPY
ncbi:MAG: hypothetical protein AB1646_19700 [Thermodesulfobacteriota bacterium]